MRRGALVALLALPACVTSSGGDVLSPREQALVALQKGNAGEAVKLLDKLRADTPTDLDLARAWAEAHVKAGSGAQALAAAEKDDSAVGWYTRGLILFANGSKAN